MFRNHFIGMGRIVAAPEVRDAGESKVLNFTIAVNRMPRKNQQETETDFIDCVAWGGMAENIGKYFGKGDRIGVEGRIQVRNYEDKDGNKRRATEVVLDGFEFIERKTNADTAAANDDEDIPY